jgi:MFS family permease
MPNMSGNRLEVLVAAFFTVFVGFGIRHSYGVLLPHMTPSLGITNTEAGFVYACFFVSYTVFSPIVGLLADRVAAKMLFSGFLIILGMGTLLLAHATSLVEASFSFGLVGLGAAVCWSPVAAVVQRWSSKERRGITLAVIDSGASVGVAASSFFLPWIVTGFGWRAGWAILGILAFTIAILDYRLMRSHTSAIVGVEPGNNATQRLVSIGFTYAHISRRPHFWLIGLSYLLIGFSILIPYTFLPTWAVHGLGMSYSFAARLVTVIALASLAGKIILGTISDRYGRLRVLVLSGMLVALGSGGMALCRNLFALVILASIFGFAQGSVFPLYAACASDFFSKKYAGSIIGLWTIFYGVGSMSSPVISGWLADATGSFVWSFILAMLTATGSLSMLMLLRKRPFVGVCCESNEFGGNSRRI